MKLRKKIVSMALTLAMVMTTLLGTGMSVFAADEPGTAALTAEIDIEKFLDADGGTLPATDEFSWTIEKYSYEDPSATNNGDIDVSTLDLDKAEDMAMLDKIPTPDDAITTTHGTNNGSAVDPTTKTFTLKLKDGAEIDNLGVTSDDLTATMDANKVVGRVYGAKFNIKIAPTQPIGVYTYKVTEVTKNDDGDSLDSTIDYDTDTYYIKVYVINIVDNATGDIKLNEDPADGDLGAPLTTISDITLWKGQKEADDANGTAAGDLTIPDPAADPVINTDGTIKDIADNVPAGTAQNQTNIGEDTGAPGTANGNDLDASYNAKTSTTHRNPGDPTETTLSMMVPFTNVYITKDLKVEKHVVGNFAKQTDEFTYDVVVRDSVDPDAMVSITFSSQAALVRNATVFDAMETEAPDSVVIPLAAPWTVLVKASNVITATAEGADVKTTQLKLTHDESFKIENLSKAATFNVKEAGDTTYRPAAAFTAEHVTLATTEGEAGVIPTAAFQNNIASITPGATIQDAALSYTQATNLNTGYRVLDTTEGFSIGAADANFDGTAVAGKALQLDGAMVTKAEYQINPLDENTKVLAGTFEDVTLSYTNFKDYVTPTGMILAILPYVLGVIVVFAFVVFMVIRKRKQDSYRGAGL